MKSLYESILSSTHSGKHFDPLSDLKRQDFQVREKDTIEDIVNAFIMRLLYKSYIESEKYYITIPDDGPITFTMPDEGVTLLPVFADATAVPFI